MCACGAPSHGFSLVEFSADLRMCLKSSAYVESLQESHTYMNQTISVKTCQRQCQQFMSATCENPSCFCHTVRRIVRSFQRGKDMWAMSLVRTRCLARKQCIHPAAPDLHASCSSFFCWHPGRAVCHHAPFGGHVCGGKKTAACSRTKGS